MIIAIDGPAAAGKGTLSRRIAETYGFHHLDTGLTYRATAKALLDAGLPLDDEAVAERMALAVELAGLDRDVLSAHEIGEAASKIAVMPAVRRALVEASAPSPNANPARCSTDATSVPLSAPMRRSNSLSRHRPRCGRSVATTRSWPRAAALIFNAIFADVKKRDERDMGRPTAP